MLNIDKIYEFFERKHCSLLRIPIIETLQSWGLIAKVNTLIKVIFYYCVLM